TAASIHEATGHAVAVAFNAGNLKPVAEALRAKYPALEIVIAADNDLRDDGTPNIGVEKAEEAAKAVRGRVVVPELGGRPCDFNDIPTARGLDAVRQQAPPEALHGNTALDAAHAFLGRFVAYPSEHAHVAHTL